jgi:hypothetical protein
MDRSSLSWMPFENQGMGVLGARLDPGLMLRVIRAQQVVSADTPTYLAWVDAFRKTHTSSRALPSIEAAKRAAVELALRVTMDEQDRVRYELEQPIKSKARADALEEDLHTLNGLLVRLLDEAESLRS